MARVLILHHSLSGKSEKMAEAFAEGAQSVPDTEVVTKKAFGATLDDLIECDAVAFGSADHFSYIAGALNHVFDRTYHQPKTR